MLALGLFATVALPGCGTANTATTSEVTATAGDATQGLMDIQTYCQTCHSTPSPANISPMTTEEATAFLSTHEGLTLSDEAIANMLAYLLPYDNNEDEN